MDLLEVLRECVENDIVDDDRESEGAATQIGKNGEALSTMRDVGAYRTMNTAKMRSKVGLMKRAPFVMMARCLATHTSREYYRNG